MQKAHRTQEESASEVQTVTQFEVDGIKYIVSDGGVKVVGYSGTETDIVIPASVTYQDETYDVIDVIRGLQNNSSLTSVDIQAPITRLNNSLFYNCSSLTTVKLPDTLKVIETAAFDGCSSLTEIDLPEGLETIMNGAFEGTSLTSLTLPASLTEIQSNAFQKLDTLTSVDFNNASVAIGSSAFQNCSALTTITNTENITSLGDYAFGSDYQSLNGTKMYVPITGEIALNNVTFIGKAAFKYCNTLTAVSGLNHLTEVSDETFYNCTHLTTVSGLDNVTTVGNNAFAKCRTRIGGQYTGITELNGLELSNLTSIGASAFDSVQAPFELTEDTFRNLKTLGAGAFNSASNLAGKLVLPEGLTEIGNSTFSITGISEVVLPNSVRTIGEKAFFNCSKLTSVQIGQKDGQSSQLTTISKGAFSARTSAIESFVIEAAKSDVSISSELLNLAGQKFPAIPEAVAEKLVYTVRSVEGENIYADSETTLQEAIDTAADGETTITATKDFLVKNTVTIPVGKTITLTGTDLIVQPDKSLTGPVFTVENGGTLILDGTLTYKCHNLTSGVLAQVNGAMELKNGTIMRAAIGAANQHTGVITVDGGTFTMDGGTFTKITTDAAYSGVVYVMNNGAFTMNGGEIKDCTINNQGAGAVSIDGGTATMKEGTISGNTCTNGFASAGVMVNENSTFTMEDGTIADNSAIRGAGVQVGAQGSAYNAETSAKFLMTGGTISGNTAKASGMESGGGGVYVVDNGEFTMDAGTITGNMVLGSGMGGGVATANDARDGGGRFTMNGGTISNNTASDSGGGVYSKSDASAVVLSGGYIVNNKASVNGGGVYVSTDPYGLTISNALVTGNNASVQGGGVWSCPHGNIYLGTDSAVFDNTAEKSGDDAGFVNKWNESYTTTFFGKMLGGGLVTWYRDTSMVLGDEAHGAFGGARYDAANPGNPVTPPTEGITPDGYALKAVVSAEGKQLAESAAKLFIQGNSAQYGGGIGSNGRVILTGEDTTENPLSLTVHKVWSGASEYPTTVTVNLIRIAEDGTRTVIGTVLLSEKSTDKDGKTWSYTFTNLDGAYTYTVEEEAVDGFNTSISGSMADGFTITNSKKPSGGGGGSHHKPDPDPKPTPDPDPDPPVDIPDQPTPLDPLTPTVDIPDDKTPTTKPETPTKTPDKTSTVNIPDSKTPTSSVPKTGDIGGLWAALCGLSAMGLAYFGIRRKHD